MSSSVVMQIQLNSLLSLREKHPVRVQQIAERSIQAVGVPLLLRCPKIVVDISSFLRARIRMRWAQPD